MNCEYWRELLNLQTDDGLSEKFQIELDSHLETCCECRTMYSEQLACTVRLKTLSSKCELRPAFQERLATKLTNEFADEKHHIADSLLQRQLPF